MFGGLGGSQNNNNGSLNVNTKIRTMYGDTACMQLSYWNENISIRINPLSSVTDAGIRQYDYNRRGSTALTPDKCLALANEIKDKILPEIEKVKTSKKLEKPVSVGLTVGTKGSSFFVEYKDDDKGIPSLYVTLYTNVGPDNKAPKEGTYTYKFAKTTVVENYDPETGTGTESTTEAEFTYFYEKLKGMPAVQGSAAHSSNMDIPNKPHGNNHNSAQAYPAPQQGGGQPSFGQPPQNNYAAPMSNFSADGFGPF